ncbi:MAG TPA: peptidyl-prolyl cis-trans isomerase [bacterium]|nr:peptidyl-prolyl cis-trans isomerase [bacterium]
MTGKFWRFSFSVFGYLSAILMLMPVLHAFGVQDTDVVARFKDGQITVGDVKSFWEEQGESNLVVRSATDENRIQVVAEELALQEILLDHAKQKGFEDDESVQQWTENLLERLLIDELLKKEVGSKIQIEDSSIQAYYEANPDLSLIPEKFSIRHIFFDTTDVTATLINKRHQDALDVRSRIVQGEDFLAMALQYSQTEGEKGAVVTLPVGQISPLLERAALSMEIGQISPVMETKYGFQLIQLVGQEPASKKSLEEVRGVIVSKMRQEQEETYKEQLRDKIMETRKSLKAKYDLEDLDSLPRTSDKVICEIPGVLTVTAAQLKDVLSRMAPASAPVCDATTARDIIENGFIFQTLSIRYAKELGLDQSLEIQDRVTKEKKRLLISKSRRDLVESLATETTPKPEDIRNYYDTNSNEFMTEATYFYETLSVPIAPLKITEPTVSDQHVAIRRAKRRAEELLGRFSKGLTFEQAAQESEDLVYTPESEPTVIRSGEAADALDQTLASLSAGEVCKEPLLQMNKFLLVRVLRIEEPHSQPFEEVEQRVKARLEQEIRSRTDSGLKQQLLEESGFSLDKKIAAQVKLDQ